MLITPDTTIKLYHNVPLDPKYNNTVLFSNVEAQNEYFHNTPSILVKNVPANTYARVERKTLKIKMTAKEAYGCNYMAFRNSSFGEKWFYAFVVSAEYVNNNTALITFDIDVMQTFMFDYTPKECFVEREHAVNDSVGANLLSEPVEIGELTEAEIVPSQYFSSNVIMVQFLDFNDFAPGQFAQTTRLHNVLSSCMYFFCLDTDAFNFADFLTNALEMNKVDNILAIYQVPKDFLGDVDLPHTITGTASTYIPLWVNKQEGVSKPTSLNGYTPKNKKLLTYPYTCLRVDCGSAQKVYKYEYFNTGDANFQLEGCYANNPEIAIMPIKYQSLTGNSDLRNYSEEIILSDFPQIPWQSSSYANWIATKGPTNSNAELIGLGTTLIGAGAGAIAGNPVMVAGSLLGGASTLLNAETQRSVASSHLGSTIKGRGSASVDSARLQKKPFYISLQMRADLARRADEYLDRFGYNTQLVKVPNRNSRPHWNYVKTAGFNCVGSVPSEYLTKIISIYDRGITFWKHPSEVGNYSLNNH